MASSASCRDQSYGHHKGTGITCHRAVKLDEAKVASKGNIPNLEVFKVLSRLATVGCGLEEAEETHIDDIVLPHHCGHVSRAHR